MQIFQALWTGSVILISVISSIIKLVLLFLISITRTLIITTMLIITFICPEIYIHWCIQYEYQQVTTDRLYTQGRGKVITYHYYFLGTQCHCYKERSLALKVDLEGKDKDFTKFGLEEALHRDAPSTTAARVTHVMYK